MAELDNIEVSIKVPFIGEIKGTWKPDEKERDAAWEMYVELVTRISIVELKPDEGILREALSSLYSIFGTTRDILRKYGPTIAQPKAESDICFGFLAVAILNTVLRPVLAKWHPILLDYENRRDPSISILEHERKWDKQEELRKVLNDVRNTLIDYAEYLAKVSKVKPLFNEKP